MNYLSEKSTVIARIALEHLLEAMDMFYTNPDDLSKNRSLVQTAINELGTFNNRMQVLYDFYKKSWGL